MSKALRRYLARIALRGGDAEQERLELPRSPVISWRSGNRLLDDSRGQIRHVEIEAVLQPEAEELADVSEFDVFVAETFHAENRIRLTQPDQWTAHHLRPGRIAAEWGTNSRRAGSKIGAHDRERGRDIRTTIDGNGLEHVLLEASQLWPLVERFEIADQTAPNHVAPERDVVTGRVYDRVAFTEGHLAAAENADADHRALGHLAKKLTLEVVNGGYRARRSGCR